MAFCVQCHENINIGTEYCCECSFIVRDIWGGQYPHKIAHIVDISAKPYHIYHLHFAHGKMLVFNNIHKMIRFIKHNAHRLILNY